MKKLLILSGKGGTGKTSLAAAFIDFSSARAIADCDVDAPNLHMVVKLEAKPNRFDFLGGEKARIDQNKCISCGLCMEQCRFHGIYEEDNLFIVDEHSCEGCGVCAYICPNHAISLAEDAAGFQELYQEGRTFSTAKLKMGRGNSGKLVSSVKRAMLKNAPECKLAIIDGSPGIGCPVIASMSGVDLVLVVVEPSACGFSDLVRLVKTADSMQTKLAVCVNKWDLSPESTRTIEKFCRDNQIPYMGRIPYDKSASTAINEGHSLAESDCPAREALKLVYEKTIRLLGL